MNDFQVHLNDNLIPLEYYSQNGNESKWMLILHSVWNLILKKVEITRQADLTSTDLFYTKDELLIYQRFSEN